MNSRRFLKYSFPKLCFLFLLNCQAQANCNCAARSSIEEGFGTANNVIARALPIECQIGNLRKEIFARRAGLFDGDPRVTALENNLISKYEVCNKALLKACYPKLKKEINEQGLTEIFQNAIRDPILRMRSPEVFCASRAYLLAQKITEMGFEAKLVHIKQAPTLIGIVKDPHGQPESYYDYKGEHWVVQVNVSQKFGFNRAVILDPQFMDEPIERDQYFKKVTGENCHLGKPKTLWDCNYEVRDANDKTLNPFDPDWDDSKFLSSCGWSDITKDQSAIEYINSSMVSTGKPISKELLKSTNIQHILLQQGYLNHEKEIETELNQKQDLLNKIKSETRVTVDTLGKRSYLVPGKYGSMVMSEEEFKNLEREISRLKVEVKAIPLLSE